MSKLSSIINGAKPFGGNDQKHPGLKVEIDGRVFTQATESEPMPVCWGNVNRSGTYIVAVFGVYAVPVKTEMGK